MNFNGIFSFFFFFCMEKFRDMPLSCTQFNFRRHFAKVMSDIILPEPLFSTEQKKNGAFLLGKLLSTIILPTSALT